MPAFAAVLVVAGSPCTSGSSSPAFRLGAMRPMFRRECGYTEHGQAMLFASPNSLESVLCVCGLRWQPLSASDHTLARGCS